MRNFVQRCGLLLLCLALTALLTSCGSGGSGDSDDNPGTPDSSVSSSGTVGILLTDKPADPDSFDQINMTIESVDLLGNEDAGRVSLYSGPTESFDLLSLRNEAIPLTFKDDVPTGTYCKIRLTLSELELVLADETPDDLNDNERIYPRLPGNGKLDLVARDCFAVGAGEVVTVQLDVDAGNSIHVVGNNNGYNFRPVVFVDVLNQDFDGKLVRLDGVITDFDEEAGTLLLCDAVPAQNGNSEGCVTVHLGDNSAFFDSVDYAGAPRPVEELLTVDRLEQQVTVLGWPDYSVEGYDDDNKDPYHPFMNLDALVVELGDFLTVPGEVAADAVAAGFSMNVAAGAPVTATLPLSVALQDGAAGANGTRIISKAGELLELSDVVAPVPVEVDGVLNLDESTLYAALVILDLDTESGEQATGTVAVASADNLTVIPDEDTVCGADDAELAVPLDVGTEVLSLIITEDSWVFSDDETLAAEQTVWLNGSCDDTAFTVEQIVIVDDQR